MLKKLISFALVLALIAGALLAWRFCSLAYDVDYVASAGEIVWANDEDEELYGSLYTQEYIDGIIKDKAHLVVNKEDRTIIKYNTDNKETGGSVTIDYTKEGTVLFPYTLGLLTSGTYYISKMNKIVYINEIGNNGSHIRIEYSKQFKDFFNFKAIFSSLEF